jgi:RNA polymerase sigma-70 factor, ECF subfamily
MPKKDDSADSILLQRLRGGEQAAFEQLVRQYHAPMRRFARAIIGEAQAEEVVQDAWLAAIRHLQDFAGRSSLKSWLFAIVGNEAKGRLRKDKREVQFDTSDDSALFADKRFADDGHWSRPPSRWHDETPEALLSHEDLVRCLESHLQCLSLQQRTALLMRDIEGMGFEDICNILQVSTSNVRVLIHRARVKIFTMIEHFEETGRC